MATLQASTCEYYKLPRLFVLAVLGVLSQLACSDVGRVTSDLQVAEVARAALPAVVRVRGRGEAAQAEGSGFLIKDKRARCYVITNHHVVWGAEHLDVESGEGGSFSATVAAVDPALDLALLGPIPDPKLSVLRFSGVREPRIGESIVHIGSPARVFNAVAVGILSATGRVPGATLAAQRHVDHYFFQSTLGAGASGGPILDSRGRVVGISVSQMGTSPGLGVAIPGVLAVEVVDDLLRSGQVVHSSVGFEVEDGRRRNGGVHVTAVSSRGPEDKTDVTVGDQIVSIAGKPLHSAAEFRRVVFRAAPGTALRGEVIRAGHQIAVTISTYGLVSK